MRIENGGQFPGLHHGGQPDRAPAQDPRHLLAVGRIEGQ